MSFTQKQNRALRSKISASHVRKRSVNGLQLDYVSGWHAIAEANRIFGHDSWDRETVNPSCVLTQKQRGQYVCLYTTKVRVTVRAGGAIITREGIGAGFGRSSLEDVAHDIGLKAAETDATKRALATFGNPFGLSLYDNTRSPKPSKSGGATPAVTLVLNLADGQQRSFEEADAYATATIDCLPALETRKAVFAFWEANLQGLVALSTRDRHGRALCDRILRSLKNRARELVEVTDKSRAKADSAPEESRASYGLAFPKERRARDKEHLRYVARHPCLVCGRAPAHAHHVKFAQPRATGLKVSDEFTVPLCAVHHDELHKTGDERVWWAQHALDPLKIAERLWRAPDKSSGAELDPMIAARADRRAHVEAARAKSGSQAPDSGQPSDGAAADSLFPGDTAHPGGVERSPDEEVEANR